MMKSRFGLGQGVLTVLFALLSAHAFASDIPKDLLQQRDPFKMPAIPHEAVPTSDLQKFPVDQFKLVGVLEGPNKLRAMIASPNGRTYFVQKGTVLGLRKGAIRKITENAIVVREKVMNVLGDEENVDTVIKLPSDANQAVQNTTPQGW